MTVTIPVLGWLAGASGWLVGWPVRRISAAPRAGAVPSPARAAGPGGSVLGWGYTAQPLGLKYHALGEPVVFLCFGPLLGPRRAGAPRATPRAALLRLG